MSLPLSPHLPPIASTMLVATVPPLPLFSPMHTCKHLPRCKESRGCENIVCSAGATKDVEQKAKNVDKHVLGHPRLNDPTSHFVSKDDPFFLPRICKTGSTSSADPCCVDSESNAVPKSNAMSIVCPFVLIPNRVVATVYETLDNGKEIIVGARIPNSNVIEQISNAMNITSYR